MPKLWSDTIDQHRHQVRDAILDAVGALVAEKGLLSVTMSAIAERTGVGRATLYKYFADVESALAAWHERQVQTHLRQLTELAGKGRTALDRLRSVLAGYAHIARSTRGHDTGASALLHQADHIPEAERALHSLVADLVGQAAAAGEIRDDIDPAELASFCLHALSASGGATSDAAIQRLLTLTLAGIAPIPGDALAIETASPAPASSKMHRLGPEASH